jgi:DNA-binding response OmpR family regulator
MATILVVEDNRLARLSLTVYLRTRGYTVYEANDGENAVTLLSRMPFDFVISDLHLPGKVNGLDILDLTKTPRKIDALLISAYGSEEAREKANALGAVYMDKPIELKEVARIIEAKIKRSTLL